MKFHKSKLLASVSAVALMLAVGACSSGNDDGLTAERDMALEDLKAAAAARDAAQARVTELEGQLETANGMMMDLQGQLDMANADLGTANGMVTDLEGQLETANGMVTDLETSIGDEMDPAADSLRGMLAKAEMDLDAANDALEMAMDNSADEMKISQLTQDVADAEGERDNYMTMLTAANLELDGVVGTTEGLKAKVTRLEGELAMANTRAEDAEAEASMLQGELDAANERIALVQADLDAVEKQVMLKKTKGLRTVLMSQTENGAHLKGDPTVSTASVKNGEAASAVTVGGQAYVLKVGASAPDLGTGWSGSVLEHPDEDTKSQTVTVFTDIGQPTMKPFGDVHTDTVTFMGSAPFGLAKSDRFPPKGEEETYNTTDPKDDVELAGTYDGVPGKFLHAGPGTVTSDAKGRAIFGVGWTFKPGSTGDLVAVQDKDYLQFGWWMDTPAKANADGGYTYGFNAFAGGSQDFDTNGLKAVTGSATYRGKAAGMYALENDFLGTGDYGSFTANATLTADFDSADMMGTIKGSITDFMAKGAPVDWKVTLRGETATDSTTPIAKQISGKLSATIGAAKSESGNWSAAFFGNGRNDGQPGSVAGEFDATFNAANLVGAFGATNRDTDTSAN